MRFDKDLQKRLAALDRSGPSTSPPAPAAAEASPAPGPFVVGEAGERHGPLETLLSGNVRTVAEGEFFEFLTPVSAYGDWAVAAANRWLTAAAAGLFPGDLHPAGNPNPATVVFFDTETTGLNNEPLFLVGLLGQTAGEPVIRQLLARDYTEEPAVLAEAARQLVAAGLVVSYNGLTFDIPFLQGRMRYHRLGPLAVPHHLDLLPVARRKLGRSLGNCRLQTLERHLCGRERANDIPGDQIPQAYHDFVADGDAGRVCRIIEHNSFDVITLAEVAAHLIER